MGYGIAESVDVASIDEPAMECGQARIILSGAPAVLNELPSCRCLVHGFSRPPRHYADRARRRGDAQSRWATRSYIREPAALML